MSPIFWNGNKVALIDTCEGYPYYRFQKVQEGCKEWKRVQEVCPIFWNGNTVALELSNRHIWRLPSLHVIWSDRVRPLGLILVKCLEKNKKKQDWRLFPHHPGGKSFWRIDFFLKWLLPNRYIIPLIISRHQSVQVAQKNMVKL